MRNLPLYTLLALIGCTGPVTDDTNVETDTDTDTDSDTDVDRGDLTGLGITPYNPILDENAHVQFRAEGIYEDGSSETLYDDLSWSSSDERVASIDSSGVAIAGDPGRTDITLTHGSLEATVTLTVAGEGTSLQSVTLNPNDPTILIGDDVQLGATGTFSDGTEGNVSGQCTWETEDEAIATVSTSGKVTGVAEGQSVIAADCDGKSAETTVTVEANDFELPAPDLRIEGFSHTVLATGDIEYTATIRNAGTGFSSSFWVQLFLDSSGEPTDANADDAYTWIPALGAGDTEPVVLDVFSPGAGSYSSWLMVDMLDEVTESDEGNNSAGPESVTVVAAAGKPDLIITYLYGVGDTDGTLYSISIENAGSVASGDFWLDLFYNPDDIPEASPTTIGDDFVKVTSLDPGASFDWDPSASDGPAVQGDWYSCVVVDSLDDVDEEDEDDNVDCFDVEVW